MGEKEVDGTQKGCFIAKRADPAWGAVPACALRTLLGRIQPRKAWPLASSGCKPKFCRCLQELQVRSNRTVSPGPIKWRSSKQDSGLKDTEHFAALAVVLGVTRRRGAMFGN